MNLEQHAKLSVAPMMDWTDRHCRFFHRQLSRHVLLYTEMVTSAALVRGGATRLLTFDPVEHPVALQLGGSDAAELAQATRMAEQEGYDEINLNVGCPSDRVQSGTFGAVLMRQPDLVAECVSEMAAVTRLPVTVKCRIGVDDQDPLQALPHFLETVSDAGVSRFTIHARKAWLKGLSPKENRDIPPLDYPLVRDVKQRFSHLHISINGGVQGLDEAVALLATPEAQSALDGVMIGRAAYQRPADVLLDADYRIYGQPNPLSHPAEAVEAMRPYIAQHLSEGGRLHPVTRHMLGLFAGRPGARAWRRVLSEGATRPAAGLDLIDAALTEMAAAHSDAAA